MLKKYEIKHIVISAGTRHTPLVYSIEHDSYFKTYSIVDERSASFFALGLIEKLREPVAVCCTSGTAAANYVSAANEAFYQQLPLLLLTADRNHYYMFQQEEQMIPQEGLYSNVCKKVVTLGHVRDDKDFWYTSRICNEALLELRQGEPGPVHINFIVENDYPIYQGIVKFDQEELPDVKKIERLTLEDSDEIWNIWAEKLKKSKVLIVYGQYGVLTDYEKNNIENFAEKYNCMISTDLISNLHCNYSLHTFGLSRFLYNEEMEELCPDILITMNANSISEIKVRMASFASKFEHWHVSSKGQVSDPFKCLSDVIACSPQTFFRKFAFLAEDKQVNHTYYEQWKVAYQRIGNKGSLNEVPIPYSSMYVMQQYLNNIPDYSLLHIANSNSIRLANYFEVAEHIAIYDNRGAHGIDGSMSAFIGQAQSSECLCFLVIGDLSFFYDMNALWNQYIGNNIRILVCNNSGGAIFHTYPNKENVPTLDEHIAAAHQTSIKDWVESRGFEYLSAYNKEELDVTMQRLVSNDSKKPIILEAFTDMDVDADAIHNILVPYHPVTLKQKIGKVMPQGMKDTIKGLLK
jgi:2-succinyl-5-enolpyruvyl-6-hydroxy-3-cyclohexene-1-carboxylate synthase